jgi:hypothetical protein
MFLLKYANTSFHSLEIIMLMGITTTSKSLTAYEKRRTLVALQSKTDKSAALKFKGFS